MRYLIFLIVFCVQMTVHASEDTWIQSNVTMPTLNNKVSGYTTDSGNFRMSSVYPAQSRLQISGGYLSRTSAATAVARCKALASTLSATRNRSTKAYTFSAYIYPFSSSEISNLENKIENVPNLWKAEASLEVEDNNKITPDSVKDFESKLNAVLESQLENIKKTGQVSFTINQADDVVCGLVTGVANLSIKMGLSFELAKHIRESVISAGDFARVYENLQKSPPTASKSAVLRGALLAEALRDQTSKKLSDYGADNFLKLDAALFNSGTGVLKNYSETEYLPVSRSLDNLKIYATPVGFKVNLVAEVTE